LVVSTRRPIGAWVRKRPPARVLEPEQGTVHAATWTAGQSATPSTIVAEIEPDSAVAHALQPVGPS
jgi:hypothetical protein